MKHDSHVKTRQILINYFARQVIQHHNPEIAEMYYQDLVLLVGADEADCLTMEGY